MGYFGFWFLFVLYTILGLYLGQLADRFAYTYPREDRIPKQGINTTRCCVHGVGLKAGIPILSFIFLRGKCPYCKEKLPLSELILSLISGAVFAITYLTNVTRGIQGPFGAEEAITLFKLVLLSALYFLLFSIAMIDVRYGVAYDRFSIDVMTLGAFCLVGRCFETVRSGGGWYEPIISTLVCIIAAILIFVVGKLFFEWIKKASLFGGGDSLLLVAVSVSFAWFDFVFFLWMFALCLILSLILYRAIPSLRTNQKDFTPNAPDNAFPCCPSIVAATILSLLFAELVKNIIFI